MKKYFFVLLVLFSAVCGIYADSDYDPFDKLAEKLLDDFEDDGSTIVVKVFNSDLGNNERKRISKSVQFALYCTNEVEIVDNVEDALEPEGIFPKSVEGKKASGWILMDYGDIIVNIMTMEMRDKYSIEKIWGDCDIQRIN